MPIETNGVSLSNGYHTAPRATETNGMALTEYAANPSPSSPKRSSASSQIPESSLLPDGFPDVSVLLH